MNTETLINLQNAHRVLFYTSVEDVQQYLSIKLAIFMELTHNAGKMNVVLIKTTFAVSIYCGKNDDRELEPLTFWISWLYKLEREISLDGRTFDWEMQKAIFNKYTLGSCRYKVDNNFDGFILLILTKEGELWEFLCAYF